MTTENDTLPTTQMEVIQHDNLLINFTTEFNRVLDTRTLDSSAAGFWRPAPPPDVLPGYFPLGDLAISGDTNINGLRVAAVVRDSGSPSADNTKGKALSRPEDFERVWTDSGSGATTDASIWRPIPPEGYVALGMVCSNDSVKPSLNAVRCVRADLVIASSVGELIWNDAGSGATQNFSAWRIQPPTAAPGEIYFTPGAFFGVQSHDKPATALVYALRMQIPLEVASAPEAPELSGYEAPSAIETGKTTQVVKLPWFAVKDAMPPIDQLRTSSVYRLERTDQWVLVGHGRNTSDKARPIKWAANRAQDTIRTQVFCRISSIEIASAWPIEPARHVPAIDFSANLNERFTHTEKFSDSWWNTAPRDIIAMAAKNKAVVVYQMQSTYVLLREDGTQVAISIDYTDDESLHLSEFPSEDSPAITPQPMEQLPTATDTAP
ncbi:hypothetical protein PS918_03924 [Pseudomonas fluorescens]|uniref:DUF946 domain-containing protein n=1 Tax=Pseudomonas fluorescens TaxID=294 RepID=A0A5E7TH80_PSEFL|nr:Vps62-related protein [Pseudomonas fluorescens]VVP98412.1 hypothetical protein PS918_03924 [Pseudomonas fluorescens]